MQLMHKGIKGYRVAIVSVSSIFQNRAGNSEYLAAFCNALRVLGCHTELFLLNPESGSTFLTHFLPQYLTSIDDIHPRNHLKVGRYFLKRSPLYWARIIAKPFHRSRRNNTTNEKMWGFPNPSRRALEWSSKKLERYQPDLLVANYFNASTTFAQAPTKTKKAILVHDVLALRQQSFQSGGKALDFDPQFIEAENRAFDLADLCIAITDEECRYIAKCHSTTRTTVFPYVTTIHSDTHQIGTEPTCLFVGSDNTPNRHGLQWFLGEVWPLILRADSRIRVRIVGTVPFDTAQPPPINVDYIGPVDDLNTEYMRARVALVPLLVGSGLKVKMVEALAHGVPVVATTCGSAGVSDAPTDCLRVHDQARDFAQAIIDVIQNPDPHRLRKSALKYSQQHFSEATASDRLRLVLTELIQ